MYACKLFMLLNENNSSFTKIYKDWKSIRDECKEELNYFEADLHPNRIKIIS